MTGGKRLPGFDAARWAFILRLWLFLISAVLIGRFFSYSLPKWQWAGGWLWDDAGLIAGRDFLNLWMVGKAAWHADLGRFYDFGMYNASLHDFFGNDYPPQQWSYPPTLFWLAAPFGLLPYAVACGPWMAAASGSCSGDCSGSVREASMSRCWHAGPPPFSGCFPGRRVS